MFYHFRLSFPLQTGCIFLVLHILSNFGFYPEHFVFHAVETPNCWYIPPKNVDFFFFKQTVSQIQTVISGLPVGVVSQFSGLYLILIGLFKSFPGMHGPWGWPGTWTKFILRTWGSPSLALSSPRFLPSLSDGLYLLVPQLRKTVGFLSPLQDHSPPPDQSCKNGELTLCQSFLCFDSLPKCACFRSVSRAFNVVAFCILCIVYSGNFWENWCLLGVNSPHSKQNSELHFERKSRRPLCRNSEKGHLTQEDQWVQKMKVENNVISSGLPMIAFL